MKKFILFIGCCFVGLRLFASPVAATDPAIVGWATGWQDLIRGPKDISDPGKGLAGFGDPDDVLGPAGADGGSHPVVSLGDGGSIVLTFDRPITNGPGADFAVFENAMPTYYELAFVEVSSDGVNFHRFNAVSLTQTDTQIGPLGTLDPADITNLAGVDLAGYGTPFDLEELNGRPGLNILAVTHVKIIDVVGSIDPAYGSRDSLNNLINDPWPTSFTEEVAGFEGGTGGFDLDAVAVLHAIPEPSVIAFVLLGLALGIRYEIRRKS